MLGSRKNRMILAAIAVSAMVLTACGSSGSEALGPITDASPSTPPATPLLAPGAVQPLRAEVIRVAAAAPATAGQAMTGFGTAVLAEVDKASDEPNIVLSPYSIYSVLAMVGQGAKANTAAQLDAALGGDAKTQQGIVTAVDKGMAAALDAGKAAEAAAVKDGMGREGEPPPTARPFAFDTANSLWTQPGLGVKQDFLDALAAGFGVGMYETDFAADPEAARTVINAWVAEHTGNLIKELVPKDVVTVDTVLALVNAIHLSAPWAGEFYVSGPAPFTTPTGPVQAEMFSDSQNFAYAEGADWQSVSIPYQGGQLAMTVVLPKAKAWDSVGAELPAVLQKAMTAVPNGLVSLTMPTFKIDTAADLVPVMATLGVTDLFGSGADLSGIAGQPGDLQGSALIHQAVITVDEKGTEAAAATAFFAVAVSAPVIVQQVTVDRPFYFVIHDTTTNAPLFIGQITNPVI